MFLARLCPSSGAQELYRWLLPVVHGTLVYRSLVWCRAVGYASRLLPLCPSSGAQELYRWLLPVVHGTLVYRSLVWCRAVGYASGLRTATRTHNLQLYTRPTTCKPKCRIPQAATICITLELLMMGITAATRTRNLQLYTRPTTCKPKCHVPQAATICITSALLMMGITVPETCWADNKFCNKNHSVSTSWPFIPTYVRTIYDALQCKISISRLEILADVLIYSCVKTCSNVDISLNYGFQQNSASY